MASVRSNGMGVQMRERTRHALGELSLREQNVLRMRFGIDGVDTYSCEEIGRRLALSGDRVREIEAEALRKLRHLPNVGSPDDAPKSKRRTDLQ
jgi:DNA-directed RNA polymerase sigma subunit (sigma70/sigma32)